jgi:hypothetical protein
MHVDGRLLHVISLIKNSIRLLLFKCLYGLYFLKNKSDVKIIEVFVNVNVFLHGMYVLSKFLLKLLILMLQKGSILREDVV